MILGELLGTPVHDAGGHRVGVVIDVRLLLPDGARRFRSKVEPEDPQVVAAIEAAL